MTTAVRNPTQVPVAHPIAQRWSPRAFDPTFELSADDITALGEAARWAPSAADLQPTRFIVARRGTATLQPIVATLAALGGVRPRPGRRPPQHRGDPPRLDHPPDGRLRR